LRKQYYLAPTDDGFDAWDVDRLIAFSDGLPVEKVAIDAIAEVDTAYWFQGPDQPATVRAVVDHYALLQEVDLSYPIILSPDGRVLDGMHRVARALLERRTFVSAVRLHELPPPDFTRCRPDDLPYDL
jgi:hypothetical protein